MITLLLHLLRLLPFLCGGHRQLALENLALRQQLAIYKRTTNRLRLRRSDRYLWVWGPGPVIKSPPNAPWPVGSTAPSSIEWNEILAKDTSELSASRLGGDSPRAAVRPAGAFSQFPGRVTSNSQPIATMRASRLKAPMRSPRQPVHGSS